MNKPLFVSLTELRTEYGIRVHRNTLWRMEKRGEFPRAKHLTAGLKAWRRADIDAWVNSRPDFVGCQKAAAA